MAPRTKKPDAVLNTSNSSVAGILKARNVNEQQQQQQQRMKGRSTMNTEAIFEMMDDPTGAKKKEAEKQKKKEERRQKKLEKQNQQQQEWETDFGPTDDGDDPFTMGINSSATKKKQQLNASSTTVAVMPRVEMSQFLNKSREPSVEQPIFQRRRKQQIQQQQQQDSSDDSINNQLSFIQAAAKVREMNAVAASRSQSKRSVSTVDKRQTSAPVPRRPEEIDALLNPLQVQLHHEKKQQQKQNSKSASAAPLMVRRTKRLRSDSRSCGSSGGSSVASSLARVRQQKQQIQRQSGGFMANPAAGNMSFNVNSNNKKQKVRSSRVLHNFDATDDMISALGLSNKKNTASLAEQRLAAQMNEDSDEDGYNNFQQEENDEDDEIPSRGTSFGSTRSGGSRAGRQQQGRAPPHQPKTTATATQLHQDPSSVYYEVNGRMTTTDPTFDQKKHAMKAAARQRQQREQQQQQQQPRPAPTQHQPQFRTATTAVPPPAPIPQFRGPVRLAQEFDPLRGRLEAINAEYTSAAANQQNRNADGNFMTPAQQQMLQPASSFAVVRFSPAWVAIGSFKTPMTNIVQCQQYPGGALLSWTQRSPKEGVFKTFNIPVDNISKLEGKKTYFEDESIKSEEQTLIISIDGMKPSEVIFGFQNNEKAMRKALSGVGSFIPH